MGRLVTNWSDGELCENVRRDFGRVGSCCATVPLLSVAWADLLISHAQLLAWLREMGDQEHDARELRRRLDKHAASVATLSGKCRSLMSGDTS